MNWRTDKPTADVIVAEVTNEPQSLLARYAVLRKAGEPFEHYYDADCQSVSYDCIVRWADLAEEETVIDCNEYSTVEEELDAFIKSGKAIKEENCGTYTTTYIDPLKVARHFAKWGMEHKEQPVLDDNELEKAAEICCYHNHAFARESFIEGAKWGAEHRDRFLNWIRDLIKAGIEKPEEALNILKRIDALINDNSLWAEHLKK